MPKLRKKHGQPSETGSIPNTSPTSPTSTSSDARKQTSRRLHYRHYAADIRYSGKGDAQDNLPETSKGASTNVVMVILLLFLLICFGTMPDTTLRIILLGETLFCAFPPFFANWTILMAIMLPMKIQSRTELALCLAMFSWISTLEWAYAWERVICRIVFGQGNDRDDLRFEV